ncbi:MAG: MiaB/RimO family radical SAM methylthiotransferase [Actinobacteria bacterium]|nr:MiaB/RimO family radical SAM methylthiotransferase [Candidatus Dormibacteraeota bacterium]MBO0832079.1 MiaB/RimO family radical SAM methylthiotransferase [Actinomycetota bacterium]
MSQGVFINLGCRTNAAETDEVAALLRDAHNFVVVNSCTVTTAADRDTRKTVNRARREHPQAALVLMGCYLDAHPQDGLGADLLVPNAWKRPPVEPVEVESVEPPGLRRSRYVLKVQDGCDNRCTFCIVWQTRGRSLSRVLPYLESRARAAAEAGYREIVLTGIDLGSYRGGLGPLVGRLLGAASPARIRLSSIDPSHIDRGLVALLEHPRLCPHLHLPLQSGSDRVLARMRRRYDVARFERAVALAREVRPDLALTSDIMVGFPGETNDDFQRTLEAIEKAGFMDLHVFRFSPRPRTAAARYPDQVPVTVAQERSRQAIELGHRMRSEYEGRFVARDVEVIWDRSDGERIKGVSEHYLTVIAPVAGRQAGQLERVVFQPGAM